MRSIKQGKHYVPTNWNPHKRREEPVMGLCKYNEIYFATSLADLDDMTDALNTLRVVAHEVSHIKYPHGDPEFRKSVVRISKAERKEFISKIMEIVPLRE